jgi:hypothetical protein
VRFFGGLLEVGEKKVPPSAVSPAKRPRLCEAVQIRSAIEVAQFSLPLLATLIRGVPLLRVHTHSLTRHYPLR